MVKKLYVGLDVHKESIAIAAVSGRKNIPDLKTQIPNKPERIKSFFKKAGKNAKLLCCYEAGCMGFILYYQLQKLGIDCIIVSPGKIPKKSGDRIKTDDRDALNLAVLLRSGMLDAINIPSKKDEIVRDFLRSRAALRIDIMRNKQRLLKFLLRHGFIYAEGKNWSLKHDKWLKSLQFQEALQKETFDLYYFRIRKQLEEMKELDAKVIEIAISERYIEKVSKLRCLKGIDYLTALSFVSEIGDFRRFPKAGSFMAYLGVVPGEYSSGSKRIQKGITKTGNTYLRRLLTEASWHYRHKTPSIALAKRRQGQPIDVVAYCDKAVNRLNKKYIRLIYKGKMKQVIVTSIGRELAGFIWGLMTDNYSNT